VIRKQPWFLDGKLTTSFRNVPCIDGSFLSKLSDFHVTTEDRLIVPSFHKDPAMANVSIFDFVNSVSPDAIFELMEKGKSYAKTMDDSGKFKYLVKL
jgi:hypothetical protein